MPLVPFKPQIGRDQAEGLFVQGPAQAAATLPIRPWRRKQLRQMQAEVLIVETQLAAAQIAPQDAIDVLHRGYPAMRRDTHPIEIGREFDALGQRHLGAVVDPQVAQVARRREVLEDDRRRLGQRRQCIGQCRQRGQGDAVTLQTPLVAGGIPAQQQACLRPANIPQREGQPIELQPVALIGALDVEIQRQIFGADRLTLGVGPLQLGDVQARHRTRQALVTPTGPYLATRPQPLQMPVTGQSSRHPGGPVALRKIEVELGLTVPPLLRLHLRLYVHGQWLAIRQHQAPIQSQGLAIDRQLEIGIAEGEWRLAPGFDSQLTIEQCQSANLAQLGEYFLQIGRRPGGVSSVRQTFHSPLAIRSLGQAELDAFEFQGRQAQLPCPEAPRQVGYHRQAVQTHRGIARTEQYVMDQQARREAFPAPLEASERNGHAEHRTRLVLNLQPIFGDQRHQLAPEADVQRGQHQPERAEPQAATQQRIEENNEAVHPDALRPPSSGGCLFRAAPHRTVPGNTWFPPET